MNSKWKYLISIVVLIGAVFLLARLYYWLTDDFTNYNVTSEFRYRDKVNLLSPSEQEIEAANKILEQQFFYLGKGAQVYAFASADNQYVLKLVKQKHYKFPFFTNLLLKLSFMQEYRDKQLKKKQNKIERFLESCSLCFNELREETGLIYLHLLQTDQQHESVTLHDKLGFTRVLDLDDLEFILQKKAIPFAQKIASLMDSKDFSAVNTALKQVEQLLSSCYAKGIVDREAMKVDNIGFLGDRALYIDVGEFYRDDQVKNPEVARKKIDEQMLILNLWLHRHYPDWQAAVPDKMGSGLKGCMVWCNELICYTNSVHQNMQTCRPDPILGTAACQDSVNDNCRSIALESRACFDLALFLPANIVLQ